MTSPTGYDAGDSVLASPWWRMPQARARWYGRRVLATGKRLVRRHVGLLPAFEARLKVVRLPQTLRLWAVERREVRLLRARLGPLPAAEVVTVIPTYKRPRELGQAVASALTQTVRDHLVVVVDDGAGLPSDLPKDPRLVAVSLSRNTGTVGVVRNVGIALTTSPFVAFLDDDNTWTPDHLERCLELLAAGHDLVYSGLERVDDSGARVDIMAYPFDRREMREESLVDASALVVRRGRRRHFSRVPRRFGDFPREDWEFVWRVSRRGSAALSPTTTARYVVHDRSFYTKW